jgi:potassium-dependent mechanosensitive channel
MFTRKKCLLILLAASFLLSLSPSASSTINKSQKKAKFWEKLFLEQIGYFEHNSKAIDYLVYKIEKDLTVFRLEAKDFDSRYHQMKFIMGNIINNPYEFRLIISELNNAEIAFKTRYKELLELDAQATTFIETLQGMEEDLNYLKIKQFSNTKMIAASIRLIFDINILKTQLNHEKQEIQNFFASTKDLIVKFNTMSDFLEKSFRKQIFTFFLIPGPALWTVEVAKLLPYSLNSWTSSLPIILRERFPDELEEYIAVLIIFAIALIIYTIFHYLLIRKINIKIRIPHAYELLLRAIAALFIFLGLFATSYVLIFPETVLFYRLGVVIFGFFAWFFSLGLKVIQCPDTRQDSSITTLFIIFSCAVLFQISGVNYVLLTLLWPIVLFLALCYQFALNYKNSSIIKNRFFWFFLIFSVAFIILSLCGYIYLSVFCCMIWFLILVVIRLGTALTWLLKTSLSKDKFKRMFIRVFLLGLGIPFLWFFLFFIVFYWASMQISSSAMIMLRYISDISLNYNGYSIKLFNAFIMIFLFFVFRSTIKSFTAYLSYSSYAEQKQRHQVLPSMKTLSNYTGWILYIIIGMIVLKINVTSILVILGGLSVGIGFGLQHLVNNFISGLIIMFGKACRPGDIIEFNSTWASILKTDIRTTTVKTFDNCIITIPNSMLIDKELHNWTKNNDLIRKDMEIGIAYGSDVKLVKKLLLEIAESYSEVCKAPAPQVLFNNFGDSALIFKLRIWLYDIDNIVAIPSEIRFCINQRFEENNITIAYPQIDLHVKEFPKNNIINPILEGQK